ncbi:mitotic checkpoint serine/threonine-protein kinase BUB1-like [Haemaphysalis longicornis]
MVGGLTAMVQAVAIAGAPAATQGEQQLPGGPKPVGVETQHSPLDADADDQVVSMDSAPPKKRGREPADGSGEEQEYAEDRAGDISTVDPETAANARAPIPKRCNQTSDAPQGVAMAAAVRELPQHPAASSNGAPATSPSGAELANELVRCADRAAAASALLAEEEDGDAAQCMLRARQQPEVAPPPPASGAAPLEDPAMPASKRHFSVATAGDLRCQEEQEEEAADLEIDEEMVVEADREKEERRGGVSVDPFSDALQSHILSSWELLKSDQERLHLLSGNRPALNADAHITLGGQQLRVVRYLTAGLHARVYLAETVNTEETFLDDAPEESFQAPTKVVLKLDAHSNSGLWEFYVTTELARRLREAYSNKRAVNSIADLLYGCCYSNSSILVFPFSCYGTLLDLLSRYRRQGKELAVPECLVLYLALELITAVGQVHTCGVIHADIKPDDVLIYDLPSEAGFIDRFDEAGVNCIRLTDFGRAIDMTALPAGTVFTQVMQTDGLISTEMLEGQPWTFQLDWFGVLGCLHMLLFGKIMLVKQLEDGRWAPRLKFKRYWQQDLWTRLFSELLNIPSCAEQPDVTPFLLEIKNLLLERSRAHDVVMEALRAKRL